jgi:hypothetical protein
MRYSHKENRKTKEKLTLLNGRDRPRDQVKVMMTTDRTACDLMVILANIVSLQKFSASSLVGKRAELTNSVKESIPRQVRSRQSI